MGKIFSVERGVWGNNAVVSPCHEGADSCPPPADSGVRQELVECPRRGDHIFETIRGDVGGHVVLVDPECRHWGCPVPVPGVEGGVGEEQSERRWRWRR